jgi:hypothetical protein
MIRRRPDVARPISKVSKPPINYVHGIFCEDVREEVGGGATFVGVMSGPLVVPQFPGKLARLAVVVWLVGPTGDPRGEIELIITTPDGEAIRRRISPPVEDVAQPIDAVKPIAIIQAQLSNIPISQQGIIRADVVWQGHRWPAVARRVIDAATATQQTAAAK